MSTGTHTVEIDIACSIGAPANCDDYWAAAGVDDLADPGESSDSTGERRFGDAAAAKRAREAILTLDHTCETCEGPHCQCWHPEQHGYRPGHEGAGHACDCGACILARAE